jgi:soluble lytic murein transglycosylase-like protein
VTGGALRRECGQATILVLGLLIAVLLGAFVLGGVARGLGLQGDQQGAADLAALAGARAMHGAYGGLFEPAVVAGRPNPAHVERAAYLRRGREAALATARRNGASSVEVAFPDGRTFAPVRIRVTVRDPVTVDAARVAAGAQAEAELAPPQMLSLGGPPGAGEYRGPFATRQGKRMRPDVAAAYDRMAAAARRAGHRLIVTSALRSNAEQAAHFARRPDPKWVARPGTSLHRLGTELDLGPPSAYGWLAANSRRFHFVKRYSWEPWHFGYALNAGTRSVGYGGAGSSGSRGAAAGVPSYVPARFRPALRRAAQRYSISAALLAAQIQAESNFNPYARSPAGAQGIAQFMPGTARAYGLGNPFDPEAAIHAQARLMRDLLRQFGSVPLALAAYNAGPAPVQRCGCVPPYPETRGYVARILGLLGGAGVIPAGGGLEVRLVR